MTRSIAFPSDASGSGSKTKRGFFGTAAPYAGANDEIARLAQDPSGAKGSADLRASPAA